MLTVANLLTVARIALLAGFCAVLFGPGDRVPADFLLAATGVTDFLDGYVARHFDQVTTLGKVLDPLADRLVIATAVIAITVYGAVPIWLAVVVLVRELGVSIAAMVLAALGAPRFEVSWFGKAGAFGLFVSFPLFLLGDGPGPASTAVRVLAWVLVVPSLAFAFAAVAAYLPAAREVFGGRSTAGG